MDKPQFIAVDRLGALPDGCRYVLSFVELLGDSTVVRLHVLEDGQVRRFAGHVLGLREDTGRDFEWRSSASGGMIPGEVLHEFTGVPSEAAVQIELYLRATGVVLERVGLPRASDREW